MTTQNLHDAERAKESTLSVRMVSQEQLPPAGTTPAVDYFDYELCSTRGRKRILSAVTISPAAKL